jgi:hypothetical protein
MSKSVFQIFILLAFLSCTNKGADTERIKIKAGISDSLNQIKYSYLSDKEVEKLIDSKSNQFLSAFWPGMTELQCLEVLRYLIDKEKCSVTKYNYQKDEYIEIPSKSIKSIKLIDNSEDDVSNNKNIFINYKIKSIGKKLFFEMDFDFDLNDSLVRLNLIDFDKQHNINLTDFNYFVELYSAKYSKPVDKTFKSSFGDPRLISKNYRRYRFLKNGVSVEIEYDSEYNDEFGKHPSQLVIYYSEHKSEKFITYEENRLNDIKLKEEQKRIEKKQELQKLKKQKEKSLNEI